MHSNAYTYTVCLHQFTYLVNDAGHAVHSPFHNVPRYIHTITQQIKNKNKIIQACAFSFTRPDMYHYQSTVFYHGKYVTYIHIPFRVLIQCTSKQQNYNKKINRTMRGIHEVLQQQLTPTYLYAYTWVHIYCNTLVTYITCIYCIYL